MLPLVTLVFIAGLQAIPDEVYSASAVDGAGPWRQFRHITLPLLRPSMVVALAVGTVSAINIFDEIYVLNGTALNTRSILMEVYTTTFANGEFAQGIALAFMVAVGDRDPRRPSTRSSCAGGRYEAVAGRAHGAGDRDRPADRLVARRRSLVGVMTSLETQKEAQQVPARWVPIGPEHRVLLGPARRRVEPAAAAVTDAAADATQFPRALLNTTLLTVVSTVSCCWSRSSPATVRPAGVQGGRRCCGPCWGR